MDTKSLSSIRKRPVVTYSKKSRTYLSSEGKSYASKRRRLTPVEGADEDGQDTVDCDTQKALECDRWKSPGDEDQSILDNEEEDDVSASSSLDTSSEPILKLQTTTVTTTITSSTMKSTSTFVISTRRKPLFKRHPKTNDHPTPSQTPLGVSSCSQPKPRLVQMQIDLDGVGAPRITCKECSMSYVPSAAEDAKLHKWYHGRIVEGFEFGSSVRDQTVVWEGRMMVNTGKRKTGNLTGASGKVTGEKENSTPVPITKFFFSGRKDTTAKKDPLVEIKNVTSVGSKTSTVCQVVEINRTSPLSERKKAVEFLKFANQELSAQDVSEKVLWGTAASAAAEGSDKVPGEQFKIYLYLEGTKCVGLCLAETIKEAQWAVAKDSDRDGTGSISCSLETKTAKSPALLGISRIWINPKYRRYGIASRLVSSAAESFVYGMKLSTEQIAFSQPTDSGAWFALDWVKANRPDTEMQREDGFLVYYDSV